MIVYKNFVTVRNVGGKDIVSKPNAVGFLAVDFVRQVALLISQRREPMVRRSNRSGMIVEIPAETRDRKTGIKALVVAGMCEETGKRIKMEQVELLNHGVPLATSPGWATERIYLAVVEMDLRSCIRDSSRTYGLASHGERIKRRVVTFDELERMTFEDLKTFAIVQQFLRSVGR